MATTAGTPRFDYETFLLEYQSQVSHLMATVDSLCVDDDNVDAERVSKATIAGDTEVLKRLNECMKAETTTYEKLLSTVDDIKERFEYVTETVDALSSVLVTNIISGAVKLPAVVVESSDDKSYERRKAESGGGARKVDSIPQIRAISDAEMSTVPTYMKGRMKTETINQFVDKFNRAILLKYQLLGKPKRCLKAEEKRLASIYRLQQSKATEGLYFCTLDDLKEVQRNSTTAMLPILRHLKRVREIREGKKPCLLVCL